jgi:phosphotransferase system IIA component
MAEIRVIFGDDDHENEEFLGFDLDNIEEAEERYIWPLILIKQQDIESY